MMNESGDTGRASLESTYHHYRQLFEDRSRMSWQEEARIRSPRLQDMVKNLYLAFWKYVDSITIQYFKIITMLNMKKDVENSVADLWTQYISPPKENKPPMLYCLDFGYTEDLPPTDRYPKSQMLTGVINWYKSRVVRYKTASEFAGELRMAVVKALQEADISPQFGITPHPVLCALRNRVKWFAGQVEDLEDSIAQLDMSRHSIRMGLFSADQGPANNKIELAVRKTKLKNRKPKRIHKITVS